ncbi:hypothetical protein HAX54_048321, partial [Datura stramonium]|nr:hypothetical protein [Datura stramonium]
SGAQHMREKAQEECTSIALSKREVGAPGGALRASSLCKPRASARACILFPTKNVFTELNLEIGTDEWISP